MTREEAIICKIFLEDECKDKKCNEYKLLMDLVEAQPCEDAVSREDACHLYCQLTCGKDYCTEPCGDLKQFWDLPSVQPESKWIPTSERQPDKCGFYLVSTTDCITIMEYVNEWQSGNIGACNSYVKAWMPLPKRYIGR